MRPWWLFCLAACGGSSGLSIGPVPPATTSAVLAGPLCAGTECTCADGPADGGAGVPDDGIHKRFEVRLKSAQALWATIGDAHLYKSVERASACFYLDLPAGQTKVELRASDPNGASAAWSIRELGTKTKSYYDTFDFNCGAPGVCSFDELDTIKAAYLNLEEHLHDRCGSTQIKSLAWATGHAPDQQHPNDVLVNFVLDIRSWAPWKQHGDPTCGHGRPPGTGSGSDRESNGSDAGAPAEGP